MKDRLPALFSGEKKPADNAERLVLAQIAFDRKKFVFAAGLWAEALTSDPKLGDDLQARHRYKAGTRRCHGRKWKRRGRADT